MLMWRNFINELYGNPIFFFLQISSTFANSFPAFAEIEITGYVSAQKYYYYLKYTQILAIFFELKKRRRSRR